MQVRHKYMLKLKDIVIDNEVEISEYEQNLQWIIDKYTRCDKRNFIALEIFLYCSS